MITNLLAQINDERIKAKYVPVECLVDVKADILHLNETEDLNGFQKWIIDKGYILDLPEFNFTPKTIVSMAVKFELASVIFNYQGKRVTDLYCVKKSGVKDRIKQLFSENGYNIEYIHRFPQKRLAVCSGLAEYGRNNITYIDEWGSFFELQTYVTDMPCGEDYLFRDACVMKICEECGACIKNCPTGSIKADRFLIDTEICLSNLTESEKPFPDWLPKSVHHSVYGCYRCQDICPKNREVLSTITGEVCFSEEETGMLLAGVKKEEMPEDLMEKIERLGVEDWRLPPWPKNLRALLENAG